MNKAKREAQRKAKNQEMPSLEDSTTAEGRVQTDQPAVHSHLESAASGTETVPFESILRALELKHMTDGDNDTSTHDKNGSDSGDTEGRQQHDSQASTAAPANHIREALPPKDIQSSDRPSTGEGGIEPSSVTTLLQVNSATERLVVDLRKELEMERAKSSMLVRLLEETLHPQAPLPFLRQQYQTLMATSTSRKQL